MMEFSEYIKTPKVQDAFLEGPTIGTIFGSACLTGHHLIIYSHQEDSKEHWLLHKNVDMVEKRFGENNQIVLKCKNFDVYTLTITKLADAINFSNSIETLSSVENINLLYPYFFKPEKPLVQHLFGDVEEDLLSFTNSDLWRVSDINEDYQLCSSYPRQMLVSKSVTDKMIRSSACFREGGRFPLLSYCHTNDRALIKCSQPLVGPNNRRCKDDEKVVNSFLNCAHRGYIIDTRSHQAALQSRSKGGGTESEYNYPRWRKLNHPLPRYTTLHDSYCKIVEACLDMNSSAEKWWNRLEGSGWLSHVKDVLSVACLAAQCLDQEGCPVLVHDASGLDSPLQVTSLVQVLLNPECRTLRGLINLIVKEWLMSGHPFKDRCSRSAHSSTKSYGQGPTFLLFLDCVHQLQHQFPLSFEYDGSVLCEIIHHTYASRFGTFLCNNQNERRKFRVDSKTTSLWSYLLSDDIRPNFINPVYQKRPGAIWPSIAAQSLVLWDELFIPTLDPSAETRKAICSTINSIKDLTSSVQKLTEEVEELEQNKQEEES